MLTKDSQSIPASIRRKDVAGDLTTTKAVDAAVITMTGTQALTAELDSEDG